MTDTDKYLRLLQLPATLMNPSRKKLIQDAVDQRRCVVLQTGTLATWTPRHSTGRSPKDTYIVSRPSVEPFIDWSSPNCIPMAPDTFDMILQDSTELLRRKPQLYALTRVVGADASYAMPILTITDNPLSALFVDNMFRPCRKTSTAASLPIEDSLC